MKKFYIFYPLFSIIFLSTIYFFTLVQGSQQKSLVLFSELAEQAYETKDMTPFIKYQSVAYDHLDSTVLGDYQFESYQVIAYDQGVYKNQFVVYVLPINSVEHATSIDDELDGTGIVLIDDITDEVLLNTFENEAYEGSALSYGINRFGFYYFVTFIEENHQLNLSIYDYNSEIIFTKIIEFDYIDYSPDSGQLDLGYTSDELEELLDLNNYIRPTLIKNITVFLIIDIFLGGLIVFIVKKQKHNASTKLNKNNS